MTCYHAAGNGNWRDSLGWYRQRMTTSDTAGHIDRDLESRTAETIGIGTAGSWPALRLLNSYRILVTSILLIGFAADVPGVEFGSTRPWAFGMIAGLYLGAAIVFAVGIHRRWPALATQAHIHLYADILLLVLAVHFSGGANSGLGVLLVAPVAGAGLVLPPRHALLFAALGTLLLLASEAALWFDLGIDAVSYTQAAVLGTVLFVSALFASALARRSVVSEEVAKRRAQDVRKLSALNERIIQHMESGIVVVDPEGRIMLTNRSADELLGLATSPLGMELAECAPAIHRALQGWQESGHSPASAFHQQESPPRWIHVQFTGLGEVGTLVSLEDAAEREQQLQQLKLASLGRLTASVAHEIRNPVGAINHSAQLLAESDNLDDQDRQFIRIVLDQCSRMNTMVENVLQLSRRRQPPTDSIDLRPWLQSFVDELRSEQTRAVGEIDVDLPGSALPARIDPEHLRQILRNLCDNAFRHGRRDDDRPVSLRIRAYRDEHGHACIDVIDNGQPIAEQQVQSMFEPFYTTSGSGTGLGLFLAREMCEANHGLLRYHHDSEGNHFRATLTAGR